MTYGVEGFLVHREFIRLIWLSPCLFNSIQCYFYLKPFFEQIVSHLSAEISVSQTFSIYGTIITILKNFAAHLRTSLSTLAFRSTQLENHWLRYSSITLVFVLLHCHCDILSHLGFQKFDTDSNETWRLYCFFCQWFLGSDVWSSS
jgi:hypothetical protein